jgi:hypothetical protein
MFCAPGLVFGGTEASGPVFRICAFGLVFGGIESVESCFPVLRSRLVFDGAECVRSRFHYLRARTRFRLYRGRRVPLSFFARPDSFLTVPMASGTVFSYFAPEIVFCSTEGVTSSFHVWRSRSHFRRYRVCWFPFSCLTLSNSFSAIPRKSDPVFMLCAPRLVFDGTEGVGYLFHVLRSLTRFERYRVCRGPVFKIGAPGLVFSGTESVRCCFQVL